MKFLTNFWKKNKKNPSIGIAELLMFVDASQGEKALTLLKEKNVVEFPITNYVLTQLLEKDSIDSNYLEYNKISFESDYVKDIRELLVVLDFSKAYQPWVKHNALLGNLLAELLIACAEHIRDNSNDYPNGSISGNIWIDGANLRPLILAMVQHFRNNAQDNQEFNMLHIHAMITLSIMGHYECEVGPSMIALANWFEKHEDEERAMNYYNSVILDFTRLLDGIEDAEPDDLDNHFYISIECLKEACLSYKRLSPQAFQHENVLLQAIDILKNRQS